MSNICMMSEFGHVGATANKTKDSHACLKYVQICQLAFSNVCISVIFVSKTIGVFCRSLVWKGMQLWARKNKMGGGANYKKKYIVE